MSSNPANSARPATLSVRVQPGAREDTVEWVESRGWLVRVTAPPVDGKANDHLCGFLARDVLGVAPSCVRVHRGGSGRIKVLHIDLGKERVESAFRAWVAAHA